MVKAANKIKSYKEKTVDIVKHNEKIIREAEFRYSIYNTESILP